MSRRFDLEGKAVLIHTGWDQYWRTDQYFENHPYLTRDAADYLKESKTALVGIDSLNIDDTEDGARPAHTVLLGANIPIVEHLCNLAALPASGAIHSSFITQERHGWAPSQGVSAIATRNAPTTMTAIVFSVPMKAPHLPGRPLVAN